MARSSPVTRYRIGPLARLLPVATAAATALAVLVPALPAAAKTTVTTAGGVVTIHVPVDVAAPRGRNFRDAEGNEYDAAKWFETQAEAIWNEALSRLPYKNCYRLEVDVQAKLRPFDAEARDDRHFVIVHDREGGSVLKPKGDTTAPYGDSLDGVWGDLSPGGVAHEVGHLLGLGDQYTRVGNPPRAKPNPGRDGTLMADAEGKIDKALVDQLGKLLDKAGKLKPCESWTGTFRQHAEVVGTGNPCSWTYEGPVQIVVAPGGSLTGSVSAAFTEVMEDPALPCVGVPPGGGQATHPISGSRDRNRFNLSVSGPTGSVSLELAVAKQKAEGSTLVGGYVDTTMNLTCKTCGEKVG